MDKQTLHNIWFHFWISLVWIFAISLHLTRELTQPEGPSGLVWLWVGFLLFWLADFIFSSVLLRRRKVASNAD